MFITLTYLGQSLALVKGQEKGAREIFRAPWETIWDGEPAPQNLANRARAAEEPWQRVLSVMLKRA
jgi:hypothetical protein